MSNHLDRYDRDTPYWNEYYKKIAGEKALPSRFALDTVKVMEKGRKLLELGCGNGRDSLFFWHNGMDVTGVDASDFSIKNLNEKYQAKNLRFICDDFVHSDLLQRETFDYCYARFVLHAIDAEQEIALLKNVGHTLTNGGLLFIEARSIHDDIYGKGICVGPHAFLYNDHYRRFIDKDELCEQIHKNGDFEIRYMKEDRGFAPKGTSDPILLRAILERRRKND